MLKTVFKKLLSFNLYQIVLITVIFGVFMVWTFNDDRIDSVTKVIDYPVILWWTPSFPGTSELRYCSELKCQVYSNKKVDRYHKVGAYLFYASGMDFTDLPLPRRPHDVLWGLFHEESPRNVEELLHEKALNLFNYSSTFSRYSDVPFPLLHMTKFDEITDRKYFVETPIKNKFLESVAPVMYLQSDCETSTERDKYVTELMKYVKVDSYGKCLKNKDMPKKFRNDYLNNLDEDEFLKFNARYKFVVAIENGVCNDYVTEKFWRPIKIGSVPIYFGSPSVRDWFPNKKSAILLEDYPTPKILAEHIHKLLNNDSLYEEYLEHKTKQIITNDKLYQELISRSYQLDGIETVREFECFVCKKLYNKMNNISNVNIVNKSQYDCPKPISALTLNVNPWNTWVSSWKSAEIKVEDIYQRIIDRN